MSDKGQTSSKHQKSTGEKKKKKSGWISRNSGSGKKEQQDTTIVTIEPYETYEEYLASFETPEE